MEAPAAITPGAAAGELTVVCPGPSLPFAATTVTLPLHAAMTDADVDRVCAACAEIIDAHRR